MRRELEWIPVLTYSYLIPTHLSLSLTFTTVHIGRNIFIISHHQILLCRRVAAGAAASDRCSCYQYVESGSVILFFRIVITIFKIAFIFIYLALH